MALLSEVFKPDSSESCITLKLSFTNIWGLCLNFAECKSFLGSSSPDILVLCQTNLDNSVDCGNFSVRGNRPLIQKDSATDMHGLTVYVKEGDLCFRLASPHSVSYLFSPHHSPSLSLYTVFDVISSNISLSRSTHPSMCFSLKTLTSTLSTG